MIIRKEINITRLLNLFNVLVDLRNKYTYYFSLLCNSAPPSLSVIFFPLLRYQVFSYGPIKRADNFLLARRQKSKANMLTKTEQT